MRDARSSVWGLLLALLLVVALGAPASATYSDDPVGPAWEPDGPVLAVAVSGGRVFVGGEFTGGVAALDASTGELLWNGNAAGGAVRALALSSDGSHLLVGGLFDSVGGDRHNGLASVRVADGRAESGWTAGADGMVRDIVVRGDVAYFGGTFGRHNGLDQRGLGAVLVSTGEPVGDFDVAVGDADAPNKADVYGLATDGSRLFVAGRFTTVDGQPRNQLASVTLATHALDAWAPARACTGCNLVWDVLVDGGSVYTAGRNASAVTAYDRTTAARRWRVTANGDAQALTLADGLLYAGGHFVEIGDPRQPRTILAALNPATGAIDPDFQPRFVTTWPGIWGLAATGSRLYAAGEFTVAGTTPGQYPYFAMFASTGGNTAPTAHAAADPPSAQAGDPITFSAAGSTDAETPGDLAYRWTFGDGTTATGETVTHAYPDGGTYTATVTVTDPQGASDSATVDVAVTGDPPPVNTPPDARAAATPSLVETGQTVTFSAAASTDGETPDDLVYTWDFGNGGSTADATGEVVTHAYTQAGQFRARVTVTDPQGASDSATVDVVVELPNTAPTAQAAATPSLVETGQTVTFSAAGSTDTEDPGSLVYRWDFGNGGSTNDATGQVVTHAYQQAGQFRAKVTVTDPDGATDTATVDVVVELPNTAPTAQAAATPSLVETGQTVTFSAAGSTDAEDPGSLVYRWDLGNGGSTNDATGQQVTHAYPDAGQYVATVTVTDPDGATDTDSVDVLVEVPDTTAPQARARFSPHPALTGADITFDGSASTDDTTASGDLTYAWRIGNRSATVTGEQMTVQFQQPGTRLVTLTVTDEAGNSATVTREVRVRSFVHCAAAEVDRTGGWRVRTDDAAFGGRYCDSSGRRRGPDVVSFTFEGPEITVLHGDALRGGHARVFVDGERLGALSFRGTQREIEFMQRRTFSGLDEGEHDVRIEMRRRTGFLEGFLFGG
jgi:PKD repeat protein